jgi:hypothetical protein
VIDIRSPFIGTKNDTLPLPENQATYKKAEKLIYLMDFDENVKILGAKQ